MHRLSPHIITLCALSALAAPISAGVSTPSAAPALSAPALSAAPISAGVSTPSAAPALSAPALSAPTPTAPPALTKRAEGEALPLFYASIEQSDAWTNTRASGFYTFAADGRGFKPVGQLSTRDITVTDGAVYHDGHIYYLRKTVESLFRYSLDWTVLDAETFTVQSRTAKNGLTLAFDMTYDETTHTCFAASPRTYGEPHADLRRVDLATGDFTTIAPLDACIRAITADSKGQLWGLANEVIDGHTTTFLYNINKETGALTRIGDVGYNMQETDAALTCDLRDDRIYWAASTYTDDANLQRTYRRGLAEIDTTTGRATFLWDFPANEKLSCLLINTDHPTGPTDPTPQPVDNLQLTPIDGGRTARLTWTPPTACEDHTTPLDPTRLTYTVTRRNDGRIIATALTDCTIDDTPDYPMQRTGYTVTAVSTPASAPSAPPAPSSAPASAGVSTPSAVPTLSAPTLCAAPALSAAPLSAAPASAGVSTPSAAPTPSAPAPSAPPASAGVTTPSAAPAQPRVPAAPAQPFMSTAVESPLCAIGRPHSVPYLETFDSYGAFYTYTLVDANADMDPQVGNGWFYDATSQAALYYTTLSRYADDWLITPLLDFDPTHAYRLRFGTYGYMGNGAQNTFEVALLSGFSGEGRPDALCPGQGVNAILRVLTDTYDTQPTSPAFNASAQPRWYTVDIFPGQEANLPGEHFDRIAFHNVSAPDDHMIIDNIYIEDRGPADEYTPDDDTPGDDDLDTFDDDVLRYVDDLRLAPVVASDDVTTPSSALVWSPATTLPRLKPALQDADALAPFTLDAGAGWTTRDDDGARTLGIGTNQGALHWPHTTEPQAFIVFNPYQLGVESIITPHSGEQCFVSFAAAGRASDDWLISPLLSGQKARFKFWAKCLYPECLNEQFEVWASYESPAAPASPFASPFASPSASPSASSSASPSAPSAAPASQPYMAALRQAPSSSAMRIAGPVTVSSATEWTEYTFTLPEGVRYAMIRCTSEGQFGLMVDDITFPAAPAPTELWGYNVYCDGQCVARELPTTTYTPERPGHYTVTAQYAEGESRSSNAVDVTIEGLDTVLAPRCPAPAYDLQGRRIAPAARSAAARPALIISDRRKALR